MTEPGWKVTLKQALADIANLSERLGPIELVNTWFDDLYGPAVEGFGVTSAMAAESLKQFEASFTASELKALTAFHAVFSEVVDALPEDFRTWKQDPGWQRVSAAAQEALRAF